MFVNLVTLTQLLLEYVGPISPGQVISRKISIPLKHHTIGITLTASCVRNSAMDQTTVVNPRHWPSKLSFPLK